MSAAAGERRDPSPLRVMRSPRSVDLELTSRCNLRCRYCYYFDNPAVSYSDLDTKAWLSFFEELGRCGVMDVCLAGGEPTTRRDLPQLIDGIVRNRMRFTMVSNGGLVSEELAAHLAASGRCDWVQVSIDGSRAEIHDSCRGRGAFEAALGGIRTLQRHGVKVTARITVHHHNVADLPAAVSMLLDELGLARISTNAAGFLGSCTKSAEEVALTVADRQRAMALLVGLKRRYPGRISAMAGPLAEAEIWGQMNQAREEEAPAFSNGGRLSGCGCPFEKIAVRADGAIIPCTMLAHVVLGRINEDDLVEVWHNAEALQRLRQRQELRLGSFEFCSACEFVPYCTGNCPGIAYTSTGALDHPSPDACLRRYLGAGGTLVEPEIDDDEPTAAGPAPGGAA